MDMQDWQDRLQGMAILGLARRALKLSKAGFILLILPINVNRSCGGLTASPEAADRQPGLINMDMQD